MSLLIGRSGKRRSGPVDGLQGLEGFRRVALDGEQVVGPVAVPNGDGSVSGGMQGVESDHRAADVDLLQQGQDGGDLSSLFGVGASGDGHGIGMVDQGHGLVMGLPLAVGSAHACRRSPARYWKADAARPNG